MKRILLILLLLVMILALAACGGKAKQEAAQAPTPTPEATPAITPAQPEEPEQIVVTAKIDTDIVSEAKMILPDTEFDVIGSLKAGDTATLLEQGVEWHKVDANGTVGYVKTSDLDGADPLPSPYYIYIEKGSHTITVYQMDANGAYNDVVATFVTATGLTPGKTPTGVFSVIKKYAWKQFDSAGVDKEFSYSPYVVQFTEGIYIHGPVFAEMDFETMYGNTYKEIGTNATAGCMRTNVGAAYWLYMNCPLGTTVEVVNGSPKGIVMPALIDPIHDRDKGRYYDPTDPAREDAINLVSP